MFTRQTKVVIVVGGGPAGLVAAIASARNGADTLLIESSGCLGGVATSGLLSVWGPFDNGDRNLDWERDKRIEKGLPLTKAMKVGTRIIKGIPDEILNNLIKLKGAIDYGYGFIPVNPETLKYVAEKMVLESGAKILYYTQIVDVIREKHRIKAVVSANKSGLQKHYGDIFIDTTGDGDLSAFAGVPFKKGRSKDGRMQGVTMVFRLGGVEFSGRFFTERKEIEKCNYKFKQAHKEGKLSNPYGVGCIGSIPAMAGVVAVNTQHTHDIDGTRAEDLTKSTIQGRKDIREIADFFKKNLKGFENSYLLDTAPMVGIRETRCIVGEYILTKKDILTSRKFKDSIGKNAYNLDIHLPDENLEANQDIFLKPGTSYDIPYRCLIPEKIENLLVAGRCISATHEAQSSVRIMPCCMVTGEAAGIAASLSLEKKTFPKNLDISLLQENLLKDGVTI